MTIANDLNILERRDVYPPRGSVIRRWGQLLRQDHEISEFLRNAAERETVIPLGALGRVRSGVVPRANAYFLVEELPFDDIPKRFRLSRRDSRRVAIVRDGLGSVHRIERRHLREVIKGPDSLLSPTAVATSSLRLFAVDATKAELREQRHTGALDYLKRGETVSYTTSDDSLKGGVPANRAQVRVRKPHWYSLAIPPVAGPRILLPEHMDKRYITTALPATDERVVIDTLYIFEPLEPNHVLLLLASLNSLLTWYQLELRGRTQHGEGVLKAKIPDWAGLLVLNPFRIGNNAMVQLLELFKPIAFAHAIDAMSSVSDPDRIAFDASYIGLAGLRSPAEGRLIIERELRAAIAERHEKRASIQGARLARRRVSQSPSIEAYASRIASTMDSFPDPRTFVPEGTALTPIDLIAPLAGPLSVGTELFNQGEVLAGDTVVARAPDMLTAQFVCAVLRHDPTADRIAVPSGNALAEAMTAWRDDVMTWRKRFDEMFARELSTLSDARTAQQVRERTLKLLRAQ